MLNLVLYVACILTALTISVFHIIFLVYFYLLSVWNIGTAAEVRSGEASHFSSAIGKY